MEKEYKTIILLIKERCIINKVTSNIRREIQTVPNQLVIEILSDSRNGKEKPYTIITERERIFAGRLLNDGTVSHILYHYMAANAAGYRFALSPTAICNLYGISKRQYSNAIKKLKEAGYLVQKEIGSNVWCFLRIPTKYVDTGMNAVNSVVPQRAHTANSHNAVVSEDVSCPSEDDTVAPQREHSSTMEGTPYTLKEDRNNTNITNNINIIAAGDDSTSSDNSDSPLLDNDYITEEEYYEELERLRENERITQINRYLNNRLIIDGIDTSLPPDDGDMIVDNDDAPF